MALRADSVQARIRRLEEIVTELQELGHLDRAVLLEDLRTRWAVERGLQLGAENLFDIGNHILSPQYGVNPDVYEEIIEQLASKGVLDWELRKRLQGLAGFRNILALNVLAFRGEPV